jgi:hypothetical protein
LARRNESRAGRGNGTGCPTGFRGAGFGAGVSGAGGGVVRTAVPAEAAVSTVGGRSASFVQPTAMAATMPVTSRDVEGTERERDMYMSPVE